MTGAKATAEKRSRHLYRGIVRIAEGVGGGISLERHPLNGNACPDGRASGHDITANFTWERMQPERWKACLRADIGWLTRSVAKRQPSGRPGENGFKASDQTDDIDRLTEKGQSAAVQGRIPGALILIGGDEGGLGESGADPQLRGRGTPETMASASQSPWGGATGENYPGFEIAETTLRYRVDCTISRFLPSRPSFYPRCRRSFSTVMTTRSCRSRIPPNCRSNC